MRSRFTILGLSLIPEPVLTTRASGASADTLNPAAFE